MQIRGYIIIPIPHTKNIERLCQFYKYGSNISVNSNKTKNNVKVVCIVQLLKPFPSDTYKFADKLYVRDSAYLEKVMPTSTKRNEIHKVKSIIMYI